MNKPVLPAVISLILLALAIPASPADDTPPGMKLIPAGEFTMGSEGASAWPEEQPEHRVEISKPFYLDETEVTNEAFKEFVEDTGYKTVAEREVELAEIMAQLPEGSPEPDPELLKPGSLVFVMPSGPVDLRDLSKWWQWTIGADWLHPDGPDSDLDGRADHPVVHLAFEDALAYCEWAGKRLPTEAEWERAARGGVDGAPYVWGDKKPNEKEMTLANIWQGMFPGENTAVDGYGGRAPVKSYQPNQYGLYDMAGNVWEWTADWYDPWLYRKHGSDPVADPVGAPGPVDNWKRHTIRGGSYLCHDSYCTRYRPSARQGAAADTGTSHTGVRCAKSAG